MALEKGIWFRNSLSGNFYADFGDIACVSSVVINGRSFYPRDNSETEQADSAEMKIQEEFDVWWENLMDRPKDMDKNRSFFCWTGGWYASRQAEPCVMCKVWHDAKQFCQECGTPPR